MMLSFSQTLTIVVMVALGTMITRFLPFIIFKKMPEGSHLSYLGKVLPYAAVGLLVVYCLKGIKFDSASSWMPEVIASLLTASLQYMKGNALLSIGCGTALYMFLVQGVFS